ncbi:MAG: penicillin acylase family protein [Chloroflexi bacterium]|nr:MAG: penicillin acylase family protein [Chloroflexota bacterium]MBL1194560.1 penicillin acylase family protein [Chloroflexota bacterium]NOH11848.1 penicillin acylase family protein [Chloroflexota bacterium]
MRRMVRNVLIGVGGVLAIVLAGIIIAVPLSIRRGFPQHQGQFKVAGLEGPVDVYRDEFGIPHIYATTEHDLFFAQGYVHSQDRFWQMDFQRHVSAGRLSELIGSNGLDTDIFLRTLGWERVAREELAQLPAEDLALLQAYADGVNAYIATHSGTVMGLEYLFLPLLNAGYEPEPWTPLHSLTWAKAMAWDLRGNMDTEIERAILLSSLERLQLDVDSLYPSYPSDMPIIVPDFQLANPSIQPGTNATAQAMPDVSQAMLEVAARFAQADAALGVAADESTGSNSWVLSGALTDTGMPLLANDPHLSANIPPIWYQNGLHCTPKGPDCPHDLVGFSFVGNPMIVTGHNDRITWGFTNTGPDVMDLYIEKINPDNPLQYEVNEQWVDMEVLTETINTGSGDPVEVNVLLTRHGPIITDTYGKLENFEEQAGIELPENYAIALRWTALEPGLTLPAVFGLNRAQNWDEFRQAAMGFAVPAQNLLYADIEGNIGYQMPGRIPVREPEHDGRSPVPGWTDDNEWVAFIPFEELPFSYNPPEGYIVTANNAVVDDSYPYHLADTWAYGYRAQRVIDLIENAPGPISIDYMQQMQGDTYLIGTEVLLPHLMDLPVDQPELVAAQELLGAWDGHMDMDEPAAMLFAAIWDNLLAETYYDELPEDYWPNGSNRWFIVMQNLLEEPDSSWWINQATSIAEDRDTILLSAFENAVTELIETFGADSASWNWGQQHTISFNHQFMNNFPGINLLFDRGPFATSGSSDTINNTNWRSFNEHYQLEGSNPSYRMIVDLGNFQNSLAILTTGQSGHPYHANYIDMADMWRLIEYHPMNFDFTIIEESAVARLRLEPPGN